MFFRLVELNESGQWKNCLLLARLSLEMAQPLGGLSERVADIVDTLIRFWEELIQDARNTSSVRDDLEPSSLASLIQCTWLGAITCRELESQRIPLNEIAGCLQDLIRC